VEIVVVGGGVLELEGGVAAQVAADEPAAGAPKVTDKPAGQPEEPRCDKKGGEQPGVGECGAPHVNGVDGTTAGDGCHMVGVAGCHGPSKGGAGTHAHNVGFVVA